MKLMKLFLAISIMFCIIFSLNIANGYSEEKLNTTIEKYEKIIENKYLDKISKLNPDKISKLIKLINNKLNKLETNNILSDSDKFKNIALFSAFKNTLNKYSEVTDTFEGLLEGKDLVITIIDDKRCSICQTDKIMKQLKEMSELEGAKFIVKDFSESGVSEYLIQQGIKLLPAAVFSNDDVDADLSNYFTELSSGEFELALGSTFDPFIERSDRGFLVLNKDKIVDLKEISYIDGKKDATITWIEYSDLECPYCAKLHTNGTHTLLKEKYGDDLNIMFQHFPLNFHANAMQASEILECSGEQEGTDVFYSLLSTSFSKSNSTKAFLIEESVKLGVNKTTLEKCLDENKFTSKINLQMSRGTKLFNITGTPGNVLINNKTGEYEVISGAYPTATFVEAIDKLLK